VWGFAVLVHPCGVLGCDLRVVSEPLRAKPLCLFPHCLLFGFDIAHCRFFPPGDGSKTAFGDSA